MPMLLVVWKRLPQCFSIFPVTAFKGRDFRDSCDAVCDIFCGLIAVSILWDIVVEKTL